MKEKSAFKEYKGHSSHVTKVRFTKGDNYLVSTGGADKTVIVWKTDFGTISEPAPHEIDEGNDSLIDFGEPDELDEGDQALPEEDFGIPKTKEELLMSGLIMKKGPSIVH